jgi:small-conductance mechanosensitive channel
MENRRIIIPNSVINSETIVNSDILDERICRAIEFNITYDTDISFASQLIQEEAMNHRFCIDGRTRAQKEAKEPIVKVRVIALGESSVKLRASVWSANNDNSFELFCDLNKSIKERFEKEGVDIAYPHRTIVNKGTAAEAATD